MPSVNHPTCQGKKTTTKPQKEGTRCSKGLATARHEAGAIVKRERSGTGAG